MQVRGYDSPARSARGLKEGLQGVSGVRLFGSLQYFLGLKRLSVLE